MTVPLKNSSYNSMNYEAITDCVNQISQGFILTNSLSRIKFFPVGIVNTIISGVVFSAVANNVDLKYLLVSIQ